jgi:hypothetical protein
MARTAKIKTLEVTKDIKDKLVEYAENARQQKRMESKARKLKKANEDIFNSVRHALKLDRIVAVGNYVFKLIKGGNESVAYKEVVALILEDLANTGNTKLQRKYEKMVADMTTPAGSKEVLTFVEVETTKTRREVGS